MGRSASKSQISNIFFTNLHNIKSDNLVNRENIIYSAMAIIQLIDYRKHQRHRNISH